MNALVQCGTDAHSVETKGEACRRAIERVHTISIFSCVLDHFEKKEMMSHIDT